MKVLTEEHKKHLSESHMGIKHSKESRKAQADKLRGRTTRPKTQEEKLHISKARKGKGTGKRGPISEEHRKKLSAAKIGYIPWNKGKEGTYHLNNINKVMPSGPLHYLWKEDRSQVQDKSERKTPIYRNWRKQVYERDHYTCKLKDENCVRGLEAHHIIPYRENIDLRHEVSNGITLCKFHHPHGQENEKRFAPIFQEMIKNIN